jgi:hypothetical protein
MAWREMRVPQHHAQSLPASKLLAVVETDGPIVVNRTNLLADLEEFLYDHRPHGPLTANATEPAWKGYLITVACPCGVVFERWVTPEDRDADLVRIARLN